MLSERSLEELVLDQREAFLAKDPGVPRNIDIDRFRAHKQIVIISGIRRSGKSTLLRQCADLYEEYYFINFDDERLIEFTLTDFSRLMVIFQKLQPGVRTVFFDEIQNIEGWERFIRRIHDEGYKIYLTGSNARLLSSELGTHLTGRYTKIELFPFSFRELLAFRKIDPGPLTSTKKAELLGQFDYYFAHGGFPEYLTYSDPEYLKRIYDDILYRDIIVRFGIREVKAFKQLVQYIFTNTTKDASYNSLKNALGIKSAMSVREYIGFLEEAYLVFELYRYDVSLKRQFAGRKKLYVIDNGMRNTVSFRFSGDSGRLLENLVFIELKRRNAVVYFFREIGECDFVIEENGLITLAIQVSLELNDTTRDRELGGIREAMTALDIPSGLILTYNQEEQINESGKTVTVMPVWRWLLGSSRASQTAPELYPYTITIT